MRLRSLPVRRKIGGGHFVARHELVVFFINNSHLLILNGQLKDGDALIVHELGGD